MKNFNFILGLGALVILNGCSMPSNPNPPPPPRTTAMFKAVTRNASQIKTAGIDVIQQGDRLTIIIPTDRFFEPMTTTIIEERQGDLRQMAVFVKNFANRYPNAIVRVTGYTDQVFGQATQYKLAQSYASTISAYLIDAGIAPFRIATQSRASNEPIAQEVPPSSAALNRRVVIQVN